jgi:hypothetical protein
MHDFKNILLLDEIGFKTKLAEIDSADLIDYLKKCDNSKTKKEYING